MYIRMSFISVDEKDNSYQFGMICMHSFIIAFDNLQQANSISI